MPTSKASFDNYGIGLAHDMTWTEWSASNLSYYYFNGQFNTKMNPITPLQPRSDSWSPDSYGPTDFIQNWLRGNTMPESLIQWYTGRVPVPIPY